MVLQGGIKYAIIINRHVSRRNAESSLSQPIARLKFDRLEVRFMKRVFTFWGTFL